MNNNWSLFDIIWFSSQLFILFFINILIFKKSDSTLVNVLSLFASMFGIIGTYLAVKKMSINYLFGTVHVILYGLIAFNSKVYGDFVLNILIFLPLDIYGWIIWNKKSLNDLNINLIESKASNKLNLFQLFFSIILILILSLVFGYVLKLLNDPSPLLDSLSTVISIFGMILMVFYYREQWWVWFIVNIVSVGIWVHVFLNGDSTAIIFISMWSIYTFNSIIGIIKWNKF